MQKPEFSESFGIFIILVVGVVIASGYLPFNMFFIQVGMPGRQTLYQVSVLMTAIVLNAVLIPLYGLVGAAVATAITFILAVVYLKTAVKRLLGFSL